MVAADLRRRTSVRFCREIRLLTSAATGFRLSSNTLLVAVIGSEGECHAEGAGEVRLQKDFERARRFVGPLQGEAVINGGLFERAANGFGGVDCGLELLCQALRQRRVQAL